MESRMRSAPRSILLSCIALIALPSAGAETRLTSEDDKTLYALGLLISRSLDSFALTPKELQVVKEGIEDGARNKPAAVDLDTYGPKVQALQRARSVGVAAKEKEAGTAYLAKAAAAKDATKTASGIVMTTLTPGTGATPAATDQVKVNYEGKLIDGKVFDSSIQRGEPATFPLRGVIACWTEAVQLMKVGGKSRIVCPSELAYGDRGSPPTIRGGATLIFEIELLDIVKK
jgi:FKBP-type peptidyl-prolyl cis-trans isomerase FkpA